MPIGARLTPMKRIADSGESLSSLQSTVNQVFDTMQDRQDELSMQHDKQAQRSTSQAFALRETLSDLRDQQIENVAIAVNGLHTEVVSFPKPRRQRLALIAEIAITGSAYGPYACQPSLPQWAN